MNPITKAEFARLGKFSPQFVNGELRKDPPTLDTVIHKGKEKIDLDGYKTVLFLQNYGRNQKENTAEIIDTAIEATTNKPKLPSDKSELIKEKLREDIQKVKIDNDKKRGALIPLILIKRVFNKLYSIDENQFKTLGINAAPKISTIYNSSNSEKVKSILELLEKENDSGIKKEINNILNQGESDRVIEVNKILEKATFGILKSIKREIDKFLKNVN